VRRLQLIELEDQAWLPATLRDAGTAYLRLSQELGHQERVFAPIVREVLERTGRDRIVDLGSGAGGPVCAVARELARNGRALRVTLTDLHPNEEAFAWLAERARAQSAKDGVPAPEIDWQREPVDAARVPELGPALRTLFNAFHHFPPEVARGVLQSAVDAGEPIAIFEGVSRHPLTIASIPFASVVAALSVPFLRPFRFGWLPLTFVVPAIPLLVLWDGVVSCLRVYDERELRELIASLDSGDRFAWEVRAVAAPPSPVPALVCLGIPRARETGTT